MKRKLFHMIMIIIDAFSFIFLVLNILELYMVNSWIVLHGAGLHDQVFVDSNKFSQFGSFGRTMIPCCFQKKVISYGLKQ